MGRKKKYVYLFTFSLTLRLTDRPACVRAFLPHSLLAWPTGSAEMLGTVQREHGNVPSERRGGGRGRGGRLGGRQGVREA